MRQGHGGFRLAVLGAIALVVTGTALLLNREQPSTASTTTGRIAGHLSLTTCASEPCIAIARWRVPEPDPGVTVRIPPDPAVTFTALSADKRYRLPAPHVIACPASSRCIGLVDASPSVVVTYDAGARWMVVPGRIATVKPWPTALSCWPGGGCAVLAGTTYAPDVWSTSDLTRWQVRTAPLQVASADSIDCPNAHLCVTDAMSYLLPGASIGWSRGPTAPWHLVGLTPKIQTESQVVECAPDLRCVAGYATAVHGLQLVSSGVGARVWKPLAAITTREEVDSNISGIECDQRGSCVLGVQSFDSPQDAAVFVNAATGKVAIRYFPSGPSVLPLGGPVCHGSRCFFFLQRMGSVYLAPVSLNQRSGTP